VANAGPDQLGLECTSPGGRSVTLNGTASTDPDGDALTFAWSSPGITFDNPASPTPTATFPLGTKLVSLTVSDGLESAGDSVTVQVVDTTPPTIVCPAPLSIECNAPGGVAATDPRVQAFLASASATDVCDLAPVITNNAPAFFPLGATVVTFTAKDGAGNTASCQTSLRVVDTTPPVINLRVDPTVLWPPNHKLVTISADVKVTDICDPNPTFALVSVVSNEPDNGLGDGDTVGDIRDALLGTPDVQFKLRAERSGRGRGRLYTILYRARDLSSNTADATARVSVPHNR
jgi:hypothetical protein